MSHDQISKRLRQFHCRDYLWELFEKMSAELECSSDYLINEAMRQYAKAFQEGNLSKASFQKQMPTAFSATTSSTGNIPALGTLRSSRASFSGSLPLPPPPPARQASSGIASHRPSSTRDIGNTSRLGGHREPSLPAPYTVPDFPSVSNHPSYGPSVEPPFPSRDSIAPLHGDRPTLYVIYNGQRIPVNKDEFIIGRGSKSSDLTIKDGNISRQHAAVVFENGAYYLKDLGSTNGVEYQGRRIGGKRIEEGDLFSICDYELRFTYR